MLLRILPKKKRHTIRVKTIYWQIYDFPHWRKEERGEKKNCLAVFFTALPYLVGKRELTLETFHAKTRKKEVTGKEGSKKKYIYIYNFNLDIRWGENTELNVKIDVYQGCKRIYYTLRTESTGFQKYPSLLFTKANIEIIFFIWCNAVNFHIKYNT